MKWAESAPEGFCFAVKVPREITHARRLGELGPVDEALDRFLDEAGGLGDKLGPLLVQLPPSLVFAPAIVEAFFTDLRRRFAGHVACEPRHASWFTPAGQRTLVEHHVARVGADPAIVPAAAVPGGWAGLVYLRLHGSPKVYHSPYSPERLDALADALAGHEAAGTPAWCIFDNTASGAAAADALALLDRMPGARALAARAGLGAELRAG